MPTATRGEATIAIDAPAALVYAVLSDVTRMGERSPECRRCEWLDGATGPAVGARFEGHNRLGLIRWSTTCVVTEADPGRAFAFTVVSNRGRPETQWRYELTETDGTTTVTESYRFVWCPWAARVAETPFPRDKQLRRGIRETLSSIKTTAEAMPLTM